MIMRIYAYTNGRATIEVSTQLNPKDVRDTEAPNVYRLQSALPGAPLDAALTTALWTKGGPF